MSECYNLGHSSARGTAVNHGEFISTLARIFPLFFSPAPSRRARTGYDPARDPLLIDKGSNGKPTCCRVRGSRANSPGLLKKLFRGCSEMQNFLVTASVKFQLGNFCIQNRQRSVILPFCDSRLLSFKSEAPTGKILFHIVDSWKLFEYFRRRYKKYGRDIVQRYSIV